MAKKAKIEDIETKTAEAVEVESVEEIIEEVAEELAPAAEAEDAENTPEAASTDELSESSDPDGAPATKAGKRSAKAVREAEAETERKQKAAEAPKNTVKPKIVHVPNPQNRHGKNYLAALELVDRNQHYELEEAINLAKQGVKVKFDPSVELHVNLGVDPRQADQMVRASVVLPSGTGKSLRVAVLAPADKHAEAKKAGADIVSDGDLVDKIAKGEIKFDVLIATPDMMAGLSKAAKVLGPRGLMPNPKSGSVTANVATAIEQAKAGKVEFRIDKQAIVHLAIGKASFSADKLLDNLKAAIDAIMKAKPSATKGTYVQAITLTTSMGPGIKLDIHKAIAAANPKK